MQFFLASRSARHFDSAPRFFFLTATLVCFVVLVCTPARATPPSYFARARSDEGLKPASCFRAHQKVDNIIGTRANLDGGGLAPDS